MLKLVKPFFNHFLAKNKQNYTNCVPETKYQFPKFGDVQKAKFGKRMSNKKQELQRQSCTLVTLDKINCVPTNIKRRALRSVLHNLALTLPRPTIKVLARRESSRPMDAHFRNE